MGSGGPARAGHPATWTASVFLAALCVVLPGCAADFPRPASHPLEADSSGGQPDGVAVFRRSLAVHGGNRLAALHDVNASLDGDWPFWLPKIQPRVADQDYRVRSQERLLPGQALYAVQYAGPRGTKTVLRTRDRVQVLYDGVESRDPEVLAAAAMTSDAARYFLLGPLALADRAERFVRLADATEAGRRYHRIYIVLEPGIGLSERDELVLWVDVETGRCFRVHLTLEGTESTRGAHVDTTFLEYVERDGFLFPSRFHERVRAPLRIDAHSWWLTGLDLNRGVEAQELSPSAWSPRATRAARRLGAGVVRPESNLEGAAPPPPSATGKTAPHQASSPAE